MIVRQTLNFAAHLAAGIAVGALEVTAYRAMKRRKDDEWRGGAPLEQEDETVASV
jgi:hypothetical protein